MDSGVRRGSDVVKALALGAEAVMIGRPTLYGTALGGEAGAARAIAIFRDEIDRVMAHLGCSSIGEVDRDCIVGREDDARQHVALNGSARTTPSRRRRGHDRSRIDLVPSASAGV